jgi:16S rRNA (cytidine1402-2'-O)-methyltransferase
LVDTLKNHGTLYLVGTPIGNLDDMVPRAIEVLQSVHFIAAEDTRRAGQLLQHFSISTPTLAYHDHNEASASELLIERILKGQSVALISDAGMPLISDPGYSLVRLARKKAIEVLVVPGPCAAILALCASGLPTDQFGFYGFPPAKTAARKNWYSELSARTETLVFYESPHRIVGSLMDAADSMGSDRPASLARELTKKFETWYCGSLEEVRHRIESEDHAQKGEFVLVIAGSEEQPAEDSEIERLMKILVPEMGVKKAAASVAEILGAKKNLCYQIGLELREGLRGDAE